MAHYHVFGERADGGNGRGPANGCCRCENHIAPKLKAARQRPDCTGVCYMCERFQILLKRRA